MLDAFAHIFHQHIADLHVRRTVENESESAFSIVVADEHHRTVEERTAQLAAIQQQLTSQALELSWHKLRLMSRTLARVTMRFTFRHDTTHHPQSAAERIHRTANRR